MHSRLAKRLSAFIVTASVCLFAGASALHAAETAQQPIVTHATRTGTSIAMRDFRFVGPINPGPPHEIRNDMPPAKGGGNAPHGKVIDPVVQTHMGRTQPGNLVQFDGLTDADNQTFIGTRYVPPDTNADVGPNHIVEYINTIWSVYDKSGNLLLGPLPGNSFWSTAGGNCQSTDDGDPIVKYDRAADRWFASQFFVHGGGGPFGQCIAVSQTGDPTGAYFTYEFFWSATDFTDYPKFGIWPDAYYQTWNVFGSSFYGEALSYNRAKMLVGDPTAEQLAFHITYNGNAEGGVLPSDWNGPLSPPPAGAPNYFMAYDVVPSPDPCSGSCLLIWQFHSDFVTPANSTFTGPAVVPVPAFTTPVCGSFRDQCVPQLGSPELLETLSQDLMYPLPYRNFGDHESIGASHTVGNGSGVAQVRWYEVRSPGSSPTLFQSGTYAPDSTHRWMPSIAIDKVGNMALNYSRSDTTLHPQAAITGRLVTDAPGTMGAEDIWFAGAGSQSSSFSRWGDYTSVFLDPNDDCTFWAINEYYATTTSFDFKTRIGSFLFPSCLGPTGTLEGHVTDPSSNPIQGATVTAAVGTMPNSASTTTDINGHYSFTLPVGSYNMTANKFGYAGATANGVAVTDGGDTIQDFTLVPNSTQVVNGTVKDGSGAGWPLYSRIDLTGPNGFPPTTLFTDPVSGYYSITLPAGFTYTFTVTSQIPGYNALVMDVFVPVPGSAPTDPPAFVQNFTLTVNAAACVAPGYTPGAPVTVLSEAFDGGVLPPGWTVNNYSGNGRGWNIQVDATPCSEFGGNLTGGSGPFAVINSDCDAHVADDADIQTPSVDLSSFGGAMVQFNQDYNNLGDTADVDVSTDGGATWSNALRQTSSSRGPNVQTATLPNVGGHANVKVRFHYYNANFAWWWQVDNVSIQGAVCNPSSGGLVVGNVSDANTGTGLNAATVKNMPNGDSTKTFATPDDPAVPDGFYAVFAGSGPQPFQASDGAYQPETLSTAVIPNSTVRLDFSLASGWLHASPTSLSSKVNPGNTDTQTLNINNTGSAPGTFTILEINARLSGPAHNGPFATPRTHQEIKKIAQLPGGFKNYFKHDLKGLPAGGPPRAMRRLNGPGDIITSWNSGLTKAWGVTFEGSNSTVWLSNNTYIGGNDDKMHQYQTNGTATGSTISLTGAGGLWVGDATTNTRTGNLWGVNVGGNNCLVEMNPTTLALTGNTICGSPWANISQRGVAYDGTTDTYFVGGWNEGIIYHIDGTGAVLDSHQLNLGNCFPSSACISGLAFNSQSGHMMVMQNEGGADPIVVLDTNNNYAVIGSIAISGFTAFGGAGMEFDCLGNLWLIDQNNQTVYQIQSGEPAACSSDIPWLSENPTTGTVSSGIGGTNPFPVAVTWDSAGLFPGLRQAQLLITTDTPYPVAPLGVNFTVRFLDVLDNVPPGTDPFENFIYAAAGANIMHGCSFFNFCPSASVTRADMAGYIFRSVHGPFTPPPAYLGEFGDVFFTDYNADYIEGVFEDGITAGCQASPLLYCPNQSIPRAQMAVFIERGVRGSSFVPPACTGIFGDVSCPPTPADPYGDWVELLFNDGITAGCQTSPPLFCPLQLIPNEQMAVFIVKAFGLPVLP